MKANNAPTLNPSNLLWLLLPALAYAAATQPPKPTPTLNVQSPPPCTPTPPQLWMNKQNNLAQNNQFNLNTNGTIHQTICQPGTLTFTAQGTPANQHYPLISVNLGSTNLITTHISDEQTHQIQIPEPGELTLTFHNDAYKPDANPPEDRNLMVRNWNYHPNTP